VELRLFPLRTVLFPGMQLPLQVFEPRYRQLVAECMETAEPFGVSLIREGAEVGGPAVPYSIGTTARIESVTPGPDGRLHLATVGERRFRILELHTDRPYLWADVEYPLDEPATVPEASLERARRGLARIRRLRATAAGEYERDPHLPEDAGALADLIGGLASSTSAGQLQQLLETLDVGRRLDDALALLETAVVVAQHNAALAAAARWAPPGSTN
jgi:Lon protease-like protein